jgi:hypothetical protein
VLNVLEREYAAARPRTLSDALAVVERAVSTLNLEPGVATMQASHVVLANKGGVTTYVMASGEILVTRGAEVVLRLGPK